MGGAVVPPHSCGPGPSAGARANLLDLGLGSCRGSGQGDRMCDICARAVVVVWRVTVEGETGQRHFTLCGPVWGMLETMAHHE